MLSIRLSPFPLVPDSSSQIGETPVDVVIRSHNDMPIIRDTLEALAIQDVPLRLTAFDNASNDGTRELLAEHTDRIHHVPAGTYVPGRVLNEAMEATENEIVVFINSDCIAQHATAVRALVDGFRGDPNIAAVFGRQIAHPDCWAVYEKDTEDTYGDGSRQQYWKHCFSMAFSAIRRSVWRDLPFRTEIQYSEDIDWTWRARQRGHAIRYVQDGMVMHSHNYTWKQFYKRQFGEGKADAQIFAWSTWERSWWRFALLPFGRQCVSDLRYFLKRGKLLAIPTSPYFRIAQLLGRWAGFKEGLASEHAITKP